MRRLIKTGVASAMYWSGLASLMGRVSNMENAPLILAYHRVVENFQARAVNTMAPMLISTRTLEQHLDWVGRHYTFTSLDDIGDCARSNGKPKVALTFDDGYADVYRNAFPLLKRKGIPFAVFVVSDLVSTKRLQVYDELYLLLSRAFFVWRSPRKHLKELLLQIGIRPIDLGGLDTLIGNPFLATRAFLHVLPQDKILSALRILRSYGELQEADTEEFRAMTWEMLIEMRASGVLIGSHTRSHAFLTNESNARIVDEVSNSKRKLESELGGEVAHFAYPDGRFDSSVLKAVADAGYRNAYTTCRHRNARHPGLTLPRRVLWEESCMDVFRHSSSAMMGCQVNGVFDFAERCDASHQS